MTTFDFIEIVWAYRVWWVRDKCKFFFSYELISKLVDLKILSFPELFCTLIYKNAYNFGHN
jgi:hypothetical protein